MAILINAINSSKVTNVKLPKETEGNEKGNVSPREPQGNGTLESPCPHCYKRQIKRF
jgi:hypothetical protein